MATPIIIQGTTCNHCVFAEWNGYEQIGCKVGRLSRFAEIGTKLEKQTKTFSKTDGTIITKTYYDICNRVCNLCRNKAWADKQKNKSNLEEIAKQEAKLKCDMILYVLKHHTLDEVEKTIEGLTHQILKITKEIFQYP